MIGIVGVGDMGLPMSGHMVASGFDVVAYDIDAERLAAAATGGAQPTTWRHCCTGRSAPT